MSFLANLNSFFVANEVAVVAVVAAALVLFQLALLVSAFMAETAVSTSSVEAVVPADGNVDGVDGEETVNYDLWATHAYMPYMF